MAEAKKGGKKEETPEIYNKRDHYKVENNRVARGRRFCPKDGPGVFLAEHKDRFSCGKCGYTEFKGQQAQKAAA